MKIPFWTESVLVNNQNLVNKREYFSSFIRLMDEHVVSKAQCNNLAVQGIGKLDSKQAGTKGIKKYAEEKNYKICRWYFDTLIEDLEHLLLIYCYNNTFMFNKKHAAMDSCKKQNPVSSLSKWSSSIILLPKTLSFSIVSLLLASVHVDSS